MENHQLSNSGETTYAVISNKEWESASYKNEDGYYYTFEVDGKTYEGHTFNQEKGPFDTMMVIYLKNKPTVNRPDAFINGNK